MSVRRVDGDPGETRFDALAVAWMTAQISASTRSAYRSDLATFARWCDDRRAVPQRVTAADVAAYQLACAADGASPATVRRRTSSLASFFRFAVDAGEVATNPVLGSARPPLGPDVGSSYQPGVLDELADAAAAIDVRLLALVRLLGFEGIRLDEALALDTDHVVGEPPHVGAVIEHPRNGRTVAVSAETGEALVACAGERAGEPLFASARPAAAGAPARRLTRFGADHLLKRLPPVGGEPVTANALRRSFAASRLAEAATTGAAPAPTHGAAPTTSTHHTSTDPTHEP